MKKQTKKRAATENNREIVALRNAINELLDHLRESKKVTEKKQDSFIKKAVKLLAAGATTAALRALLHELFDALHGDGGG